MTEGKGASACFTRLEHVREYDWGKCVASAQSDMPGLRQLLFGSALQDLKAETEKRYHAFRKRELRRKHYRYELRVR